MGTERCANVDKKGMNHVLFQMHNVCLRIDNHLEVAEIPGIAREVRRMESLDQANE